MYRELLPASPTCEHNAVEWEIDEPNAEPAYMYVTVTCKASRCDATVFRKRMRRPSK